MAGRGVFFFFPRRDGAVVYFFRGGTGWLFFFFSTGWDGCFWRWQFFWRDGEKSLHRPAKGGLNRPASRPCKALERSQRLWLDVSIKRNVLDGAESAVAPAPWYPRAENVLGTIESNAKPSGKKWPSSTCYRSGSWKPPHFFFFIFIFFPVCAYRIGQKSVEFYFYFIIFIPERFREGTASARSGILVEYSYRCSSRYIFSLGGSVRFCQTFSFFSIFPV